MMKTMFGIRGRSLALTGKSSARRAMVGIKTDNVLRRRIIVFTSSTSRRDFSFASPGFALSDVNVGDRPRRGARWAESDSIFFVSIVPSQLYRESICRFLLEQESDPPSRNRFQCLASSENF